jgi:hypothetical protein
MSKAVERPVCPWSRRYRNRSFVSSAVPKPANWRIVPRRPRYMSSARAMGAITLSGAPNTNAYYTHITAIKVGSVSGALSHVSGKSLSPRVTN